jgi:hypothetical protein
MYSFVHCTLQCTGGDVWGCADGNVHLLSNVEVRIIVTILPP